MRPRIKLTEKRVHSCRPDPARDVYLRDTEQVGFGVRVKPSGSRSYFIEYRAPSGRNRRMSLGPIGRYRLEEARAIAREHFAAIARGFDPLVQRRAARDKLTVAELAELYLDEHLRPTCKPSTIYEYDRILRREVIPALGRIEVEELMQEDVERLHRSIGRRAKRTANYTIGVIQAMLGFAERRGLRAQGTNPAALVTRYPEHRLERFLTGKELARVAEAIEKTEKEIDQLPTTTLALRLLLLTGMRAGEVLSLRWDDVDWERGFIVLPDSKTGRKALPLTAPVRELLANAERQAGNPYVCFGSRDGEPLATLQHVWQRVRESAGLEDVRLHDLRHSFASVGASAGLGLYIVGKVLGHSSPQTTARYAHLAEDPVRAGAERIASEIARALEGSPGGEVVEMGSKERA